MGKKKLMSIFLASKINADIKRILGSVTTLENALSNFGMQLDVRKEQVAQIHVSEKILKECRDIKAFLQVHNIQPAERNISTANSSLASGSRSDTHFSDEELKQVKAFSHIPSIIAQIQSSSIPEIYKKDLVTALRNSEKTWRYSRQDFTIDKIGGEPKLISALGGFKVVYQGKLDMKSLEDDRDIIRVPVAILEYSLVDKDLDMYKGSLLREIYLSYRLDHPCIVKTFGAFWPIEAEQGMKPKIFSELMTHNLRNGRNEAALQDER